MNDVGKSQSWPNCDEDVRQFVLDVVGVLKLELDRNLVGVYLHGSLAMGGYYRPKSDLDLIVVVKDKLGPISARDTGIAIAKKAEDRPTTGNVELSIITEDAAKSIPIPVPFELHYSTEWHDKALQGDVDYDSRKTDEDLLSHLKYVQQRGICLYGEPISEVFGEYDWKYFMDSVVDDFEWILEGDNILETPFYGVLNICRVLQLFSENKEIVHSKDEGGEWGLKNLPERYRPLVKEALDAYHSSDEVTEEERRTAKRVWAKDDLLALAEYARQEVSQKG